MKISSIPKSGRKGSVVYVNSRHGNVVREDVRPGNPRTAEQQSHRSNVRAATGSRRKNPDRGSAGTNRVQTSAGCSRNSASRGSSEESRYAGVQSFANPRGY